MQSTAFARAQRSGCITGLRSQRRCAARVAERETAQILRSNKPLPCLFIGRTAARLLCLRSNVGRARAVANSEEGEETLELEIKVEGMVCGGCSSRVAGALQALPNVKAVQVSLETKLATVEVAAQSQLDALQLLPKLTQTVKDLGFEAEPYIQYEFENN